MKRRVFYIGVLLAVFSLFIIGVQGSNAGNQGNTGRTNTVEIQVTQYIWELVSNHDGRRVLCQVTIEHPNQPNHTEAVQLCGEKILPAGPVRTLLDSAAAEPSAAQPELFDLEAFFRGASWRFVTTQVVERTVEVPLPGMSEMIVNLSIPAGQTTQPFFVVIKAYEPQYGQSITGITGILDGLEFTCQGSRCDVPITRDSLLEFWATSSLGDESHHTRAAFRIQRIEDQISLELVSLEPVVLFQDSCAAIWGQPLTDLPAWAALPATPDELNTIKPYQYLAGKLLSAGVVDGRDCPGGGLGGSGGPNTCGLEKAALAVIEWQNQYDVAIWEAGRTYGIPPVLIKTLIGQESQFWPGNGQRVLYEYGLGQMSQVGADVLLRWDNEQFATTCNSLLYDCSQPYGRLLADEQDMLRGWLMRSLDAACPSCENGVDMQRAYDSIPVFTRTLRANCYQVKFMLDRAKAKATYEDLWKFTLVSYHSGYTCLSDAFAYYRYKDTPYDWPNISAYLSQSCESGMYYVNNLWQSLEEFDTYRIKTPASSRPVVLAGFAKTPVPIPVPTIELTPTSVPVLALSHIRVIVYVDQNNNNFPDRDEGADNVNVAASFDDGQVASARTVDGEVIFDLTGRAAGGEVLVTLPELFRSQRVRITRDGEIPIVFRIEQPVVPPVLP